MKSPIPLKLLRHAVILALFLTACRPAPINYQLTRQGTTSLLIPPGQPTPASTPEFRAIIKNARRNFSSNSDCSIKHDLITLRWRGSTAEVHLKSQLYSAAAGAPISADPTRPIPLGPLQTMEAFRAGLLDLQSKNCLTSAEFARLLREITERFPLPPDAAYRLRFGSYAFTGFFDLTSDFRLQIVRPIYADSAASKIVGFETSYYLLTPAKDDSRVRISLASVTDSVAGKPPVEKNVPLSTPAFPSDFSFYRLVFRRSREAGNQVTIAIILASAEESKLNEAARLIEAANQTETAVSAPVKKPGDPLRLNEAPDRPTAPLENPCDGTKIFGLTCISFPSTFAVNPELRVLANGKETFVPPGAGVTRVFEAMRPQPSLTDVLKTLQIQRQFQGRLIPVHFDSATRDIFYFTLMPGDVITW
jgi:hypothetical protein